MKIKKILSTLALVLTVVVAAGSAYKLLSPYFKDDEKKPVTKPAETVHEHVYVDDYVCDECGYELSTTEGLAYSQYGESEPYIEVTGIGTATATDIVIPESYNGVPVTSIGSCAFEGNTDITSVFIPSGVSVANYAFAGTTLESVTIINNKASYLSNAFVGCAALKKVTFLGELTEIEPEWSNIESDIFKDCDSLERIEVPKGLLEYYKAAIPNYASIIVEAQR